MTSPTPTQPPTSKRKLACLYREKSLQGDSRDVGEQAAYLTLIRSPSAMKGTERGGGERERTFNSIDTATPSKEPYMMS